MGTTNSKSLSNNKPIGGTRIGNIDELKILIQPGAHIAVHVQRPSLDYYHHFIIIDQECNDTTHSINIIHYRSISKIGPSESPGGQIVKETIKLDHNDQNVFDFDSGVYFVQKEGYPKTEKEAQKVIDRAMSRLGERRYRAASNNCESFATWASTGKAVCDQMENANAQERGIVDSFDGINNLKYEPMDIAICWIMTIIADHNRGLTTAVSKNIFRFKQTSVTSASNLTLDKSSSITSEAASSAISENSSGTNSSTLSNQATNAVDVSTRNKDLSKIAAFTLVTEAIFLTIRIRKLHGQRQHGHLQDKDFKREVAKEFGGFISSILFREIGTAIGNNFSSYISSALMLRSFGSVLAKTTGSAIGGLVHDTIARTLRGASAGTLAKTVIKRLIILILFYARVFQVPGTITVR